MAIKLISVKCPDCGASLQIESGRKQAFCTYCGAKVIVHNTNEKYYHHYDEARMMEAETDRIIRMKQMELEEENRKKNAVSSSFKIIFAIIMGIIGSLMTVGGYFIGSASGDGDSPFYFMALIGLLAIIGAVGLFSSRNDR